MPGFFHLALLWRVSVLNLYCQMFSCSHLPADGHLGCFHSLTVNANAAVNTHIHVCMWAYVLISPIHGVSGSCGNSVEPFKELQAVFQVAARLCLKHLT